MREIQNKALLQQYINQHHIDEFFDTPDLPFCLIQYEAGEVMNVLRPQKDYIKFFVKGRVRTLEIREDGSSHQYYAGGEFHMYGDMEFCGYDNSHHWQEVIETVQTVELPLALCREKLWRDVRFLQQLARSTARVAHALMNRVNTNLLPAGERVMNYLLYIAPDHTIRHVGQTAFRLNCSYRQLQRILQEYIDEGKVKKMGRGCYTLVLPV